jgi:hypothetical protein
MVRLLGEGQVERAWTLSAADGGFYLDSIAAGRYTLEIERIGFETWRSDRFELAAGTTLRRTFRVPVRPVELGGIKVEAKSSCRTRSEEGPALAALWSEIHKALDLTHRTEERAADRFRLRRHERSLDHELRVLKESALSGTKMGHATYRSVPVDTLVGRGWAHSEGGRGLDLYAPDAPALLSDAFGETHCFRLVSAPDSAPNELGLSFSPRRERTVPDVEGTLWVDTVTARLRALTFHYVHLREPYPDSLAHGRVDYRALPGGEWVVDGWWIRIPSVVERRTLAGRRPGRILAYADQVRYDVSVWQEFGGELVGAATPGRVTIAPHHGQISGIVYDSAGGPPAAGAAVRIEGTRLATRTDARGAFMFPDVPPGRYRVTARGLPADSPAATTVDVGTDGVAIVRLVGPSPGAGAARTMGTLASAGGPDSAAPDATDALATRLRREAGMSVRDSTPAASGEGTLIGTVRAADGDKPLDGAVLQVVGSDLAATTNGAGRFRLPGIGSGPVRVTARYLGYASDTTELTLQPGALTVVDFRLVTRAIPVRALTVSVQRSIRNTQVQGFYERMQRGSGGLYAGRDQVNRYGLRGSLSRMLHVRITQCRGGETGEVILGCQHIVLGRAGGEEGNCRATFFVDGHQVPEATFTDLLTTLPPEAVEGVEVHEASNAPPQYGSNFGSCGVLLLWTRSLAGGGPTAGDSARTGG